MIEYSEDLPSLELMQKTIEEIHQVIIDDNDSRLDKSLIDKYVLDVFQNSWNTLDLKKRVCQFCAGWRDIFAAEDGQYICHCRIRRRADGILNVSRKKHRFFFLNYNPDEPAQPIEIKYAPKLVITIYLSPFRAMLYEDVSRY
jgi:hypothetical protein